VIAKFGQPRGGRLDALAGNADCHGPWCTCTCTRGGDAWSTATGWPGMGLMLVLDHGGGYMSLYGHNEELFRKVGDTVVAGDVIGSVGDSGGTTASPRCTSRYAVDARPSTPGLAHAEA
jgi:hypothetical protein